jgi:hypothetical protein
MKASLAASMLGFHLATHAAVPGPVAPVAPLLPRLTEDAIHKAVREVLDESPKANGVPHATAALRGDKYENFSRQFSEAAVPDCLGPDGLKHQPTAIVTKSWVFGVSGVLAAPFVLVAKMRGKCH